jgi:fatty-acyl-CoA synthase
MTYNLADAFDVIAATCPEREALVQGGQHLTWQTLERRARNVSAWMLAQGASRQGKVAIYTYNHPAYMEGVYAAMKASLVPANVNYRYREEELRYLLDNADAEIAIVHEEFVPLMAKVAPRVPRLRGVLVVGEEGGHPSTAGLPNAASYDAVASTDAAVPRVTRSPDDHLFLYTGGTTGMPKAVMWRQSDLYLRLAGGGLIPPPKTLDDLRAQVLNPPLPTRTLIGPPLMHGTGWFTAVIAWLTGGAVILLDNPKRFDASELFGIVEREKPAVITIVGDSFAKPMLRELEHPKRPYDLSSLAMIVSSGVMWSQETKEGLLKYVPQLTLVDSLGSSEAIGMGLSITTAAGSVQTGKFQLSDTTRLLDETLQVIDAKPGSKGLVGVGGPQPVGYYKDPEKSARTFVDTPHGRFSVPGDWAQVNEDGQTLLLLGRGSVCINTGGEKVFPEEVEEVVKRAEGVRDCVVVGVPDERFGEAITAVVSVDKPLDADVLKTFVKQHLASYKAPKHVVFVEEVYRSPSGKADFKRTKDLAMQALGIAS